MADDFRKQLAGLRAAVQSIDERLASGNVPPGDISNLKADVDDLRLHIWASMSAAGSDDAHVRERFRLRRAADICRSVAGLLERGGLPADLPELAALGEEVRRVVKQLP
jgi:hypothetical protein